MATLTATDKAGVSAGHRFADGTFYTADFLWRRRRNWLPIFFLYATFYM